MSILSALMGLIGNRLGFTVRFAETGYTNMKDRELLIRTQDSVWDSQAFMPTYDNGLETTYCNMAVRAVFSAFKYRGFDGMTADEIMAFVRQSQNFARQKLEDGQFLANTGVLVIAGLTSAQLGQPHGHVCTLTPGVAEWSGHWDAKAPACFSIGKKEICFRSKGVNWAFVPVPELWAWKPSMGG